MSSCPVPGDGRCPIHFESNTCPCCLDGYGDHRMTCATMLPKPDGAAWGQRWVDVQDTRAESDIFVETTALSVLGVEGLYATGEDTCTCIREQLIAKAWGLA